MECYRTLWRSSSAWLSTCIQKATKTKANALSRSLQKLQQWIYACVWEMVPVEWSTGGRVATMMKKSLNLQLYPYMWFQASWFKFKVRLYCNAVNFSVLNVDISNVMYKLKWVWSLNHCSIITLNLWVTWILEYLENNLWSIGFDIMRFYCMYHSLRPWSFPLEPH